MIRFTPARAKRFIAILGTGHSLVDASVPRHEAITLPEFLDFQSAEDYLVTNSFWHPGYIDGTIIEVEVL